jgi:hypothetical protein
MAAMSRHGITPAAHIAKRAAAADRSNAAAAARGFDSIAGYIADRRARGVSWKAMSAEVGMPQTSLRRRLPADV